MLIGYASGSMKSSPAFAGHSPIRWRDQGRPPRGKGSSPYPSAFAGAKAPLSLQKCSGRWRVASSRTHNAVSWLFANDGVAGLLRVDHLERRLGAQVSWQIALVGTGSPGSRYVMSQSFVYTLCQDFVYRMCRSFVYR